MDLIQTVIHTLNRFSALPCLVSQRVMVAVSGGADSLCLLHLLHRLQPELGMTLAVATLDHGLRGEAGAADAAFVAALARDWGLPTWHETADVRTLAARHSMGIEEAARRARYSFLAKAAGDFGAAAIATGHHADDQAETMLMNLVRGTGLAGLRGMQVVSPLSPQHLLPGESLPGGTLLLVRPLLELSRAQIGAYCAHHNLEPRVDATNAELTTLRNRVRHEVLPLLESLNPEIRQQLARTGQILSDDYTKLIELAQTTLAGLTHSQSPARFLLDLAGFRAVDASMQRWVLRLVVQALLGDSTDTGFTTLEAARQIAQAGATGQQATLPGGITLRVTYDTVLLERPDAPPASAPDWPLIPAGLHIPLSVPGVTRLPESRWRLAARWLAPDEAPAAFFDQPFTAVLAVPQDAALALRTRLPGDRLAPLGMGGKAQKLKDILINARIPASLRDHLPLLAVNGALAWVPAGPHSRIAEAFAVRPSSGAVLLLYYTQEEGVISCLP